MVASKTQRRTELKERLREAGLRATGPRLEVLAALEAQQGAVTHGDLADRLADQGIDRATVYRNLTDLTEAGILRRTDLGDHVWRFELIAGEGAHEAALHPHFICGECGTVSCMPDVEVVAPRSAQRTLRRPGTAIQVRGTCDACA